MAPLEVLGLYLLIGLGVLLIAGLALMLFLFILKGGTTPFQRERRAFKDAARLKGLRYDPCGMFRRCGLHGTHRGRFIEVSRLNRRLVRFRVQHNREPVSGAGQILLRVSTPEWPVKGERVQGVDPVFESEFVLGGNREQTISLLTEDVKECLYALRDVMGYFEVIFYQSRRRGKGTLACLSTVSFVGHEDIITVMNRLIQLAQAVEESKNR